MDRSYAWPLALLVVAALIPFAVAPLPVMTDLYGHIGRYAVMLHGEHSAWLSTYYDFQWRLVGNLGGDLIAWGIGPWTGAQRAGIIAAALMPVLGIAGVAAASRALHGRIQPSALAAAIFVLGNPFHFGFVNYGLATGLAFLSFAAWVRLREGPPWRLLVVVTPMAFVTWLAHAMGWVVLVLLVAGFEGERWARDRRWRSVAGSIPRGLALLPPLILTLARSGGSGSALGLYQDHLLMRKLMGWVAMLRGGSPVLDIGTPMILGLAMALLWWRGSLTPDRGWASEPCCWRCCAWSCRPP